MCTPHSNSGTRDFLTNERHLRTLGVAHATRHTASGKRLTPRHNCNEAWRHPANTSHVQHVWSNVATVSFVFYGYSTTSFAMMPIITGNCHYTRTDVRTLPCNEATLTITYFLGGNEAYTNLQYFYNMTRFSWRHATACPALQTATVFPCRLTSCYPDTQRCQPIRWHLLWLCMRYLCGYE